MMWIPAVPSIIALVTLHAEPAKMGQILSGFALIDGLILSARNLYSISCVYDASESTVSTHHLLFYLVSVNVLLNVAEADQCLLLRLA